MLVFTIITTLLSPFLVLGAVYFDQLDGDFRGVFYPRGKIQVAAYTVAPATVLLLYALHHDQLTPLNALRQYLLVVFALTAALWDWKSSAIPNRLIVAMLVLWAITIIPELVINPASAMITCFWSFLGFLTGGGLFLLVYIISRRGLGGGDVKLMAAIGLYVTFSKVLVVMFYGSVLVALTGLVLIALKRIGRKDPLPLAPFLFIGVLAALFS